MKVIKCNSKEFVDNLCFVRNNKQQLGKVKKVIIIQNDGMTVIGENCKLLFPFCSCGDYFNGKYDPNYGLRAATSVQVLTWLGIIKEDEDTFEGLQEQIHKLKEVRVENFE